MKLDRIFAVLLCGSLGVLAFGQTTTDPGMSERAAALGRRIRSEDGVARAVATFERHMKS